MSKALSSILDVEKLKSDMRHIINNAVGDSHLRHDVHNVLVFVVNEQLLRD